jgi:hypothetical protein
MTNQFKALQQEIGRLSAQNALLEAKLKEALSVQPAAVDPRELARAEEKIRALLKEKELLKVALEQEPSRAGRGPEPSVAEQEKRILEEANQKLARQIELAASLQTENDFLKKQLAEMKSGSDKGTGDPGQELQAAKAMIAALQATNNALRAEQILLENRLTEAMHQTAATTSARGGDQQLQTALARLEAYEAKKVPYTAEELALFKKPDLKAAVTLETPPAKKKPLELPPGAGPLFAEAERAIDAGRFAEAEKIFSDVLRQDEKNVIVLANLAAAQIEQNHLADAEKNIKQALVSDPEDPASLFLMGRLKILQEKYDEALDALSLSARLAPDQPRTQYWLGKALIQKGSRVQAETALRKAVQLRPGWSEAHFSLAMVYATQQPPFKELAQWHYQKAIASGYPRDAEFEKLIEEKRTSASVP